MPGPSGGRSPSSAPPSPLRIFPICGDGGPNVDAIDFEVERDRPRWVANSVRPTICGALKASVVNEQPPQRHVVRLDRRADFPFPAEQRTIHFAFAVRPRALQRHGDALHQNLTVTTLPREPSRPSVCPEPTEPLNEFLRRDHGVTLAARPGP